MMGDRKLTKFEKKVCLVTGGSTGIGKAIALDFARKGANIVIASRNIDKSKMVCQEFHELGYHAIAIRTDITQENDVKNLINQIIKVYGKLDIAVNNAGVSSMGKTIDLTEEDWDLNMNVNAKGVFFSCKYEAKIMVKQGFGKIINIASMGSKRGIPLLSHYCASKYAVIGFSKTLALELAPYKINVNCVCPGLVKTDMQKREIAWEAKLRNVSLDKVIQEYINMTPLGRLEEPEDVAKLVLFLASPESDFMTGQAINITGGIETN
jgi:NAD(P)-dependent dehydrogenase (short-subunit alcohol dehydrogenase family)